MHAAVQDRFLRNRDTGRCLSSELHVDEHVGTKLVTGILCLQAQLESAGSRIKQRWIITHRRINGLPELADGSLNPSAGVEPIQFVLAKDVGDNPYLAEIRDAIEVGALIKPLHGRNVTG